MDVEPPSWAEQARTALALTTVATLLTRSCRLESQMTVVRVEDQDDGRPVVWLDPGSPVAAALAACPVATLAAPGTSPHWSLHVTGRFERLRGGGGGDRRGFRPTLHAVRMIGPAAVPIPVTEFCAARPLIPSPRTGRDSPATGQCGWCPTH